MSPNIELDAASLTSLHWVGVVLALVSGLVHLALGIRFLPGGLAIAFVLAGLGFLGGVVLLLLNVRRRLLYLVGIPFVGVQFVAYFALNWGRLSPLGLGDKVVQLALVAVLVVLYRRES